ncbi:MAG: tetratricopeptide repeat protein [Planctomycetota bacterium]|nr:tetratricopeptide repeat protein [Planctomycetota bacterium]
MERENPMVDSSGDALEATPRQQAKTQLRDWIQQGLDPESVPPRKGATHCSLLLISGASGIGKTRLIAEALSEPPEDTGSILSCRVHCHERQGIPFLPVLRLVKDLIIEHGETQGLWRRYAHVLVRVFPELQKEVEGVVDQEPLSGSSGRIQFHQALTGILWELARDRTLVLVLHDLHRSDPGTIEFVEYLARNSALSSEPAQRSVSSEGVEGARDWKQIRSREGRSGEFASSIVEPDQKSSSPPEPVRGRLLIVADHCSEAGHRSEGLPATAPELQGLASQPFCRVIDLPSWTEPEVSDLVHQQLGSEPPAGLVATITDVCEGNPLLVLEMCKLLQDGGVASPLEAESVEALLDSARGGDLAQILIERRVAALPPLERRLLEQLAMLRRPVQLLFLVRCCGVSQERLEEAMAQLIQRGFVDRHKSRRTVRFHISHEIHMRGIRSAIRPEAAKNLQKELGLTLSEDARSQDPVRAYEVHELLAAADEPTLAIPYGFIAMDYFAGAYAEPLAIRIGKRMLESLGVDVDPEVRCKILSQLARLEVEVGQLESGKLHIKLLLEDSALAPVDRVESRFFLGEIYHRLGEPLKGIRALNRISSAELAAAGPLNHPRMTVLRARLRLQRRDIKRAMSHCLQAQKQMSGIEQQEGADSLHCQVLEILAETHLARGDSAAALNSYQRLLDQVERGQDQVALGSVLRTIGRVYYERGNYFRAARYLFRALEVVDRSQDVRSLAATYELLGKVYRNSGDFSRSLEHFRRSLTLRERIGDSHQISSTLNSIGSLHAHSGDYARAIRFFKRSISNSEKYGSTEGIVRSFLHLGWVWFALGERKQVENLARQILILTQEFELPKYQAEGHRLLGNLALLRRDWKVADRELKKSFDLAQKQGLDRVVAASLFDRAQLGTEREEYEESLKLVSRGLLTAESLQLVPLIVRGLLVKGVISLQRNEEGQEKALGNYNKALQMISGDSLLPLQWQIHYALARVQQSSHDFEGARVFYDRAAAIIERISQRLPEDMRVVYLDDRRRKNFFADLQRFRRESDSLPPATGPGPVVPSAPDPDGAIHRGPDFGSDLLAAAVQSVTKLGKRTELRSFLGGVLEESRKMVPSPRGFVAALRKRRWQSLADIDMGLEGDWLPPHQVLGALAQECLDRGAPMRSGAEGWESWISSHPQGGSVRGRSLLAIPFCAEGVLSAALVLERPTAGNPFQEQDVFEVVRLLSMVKGQMRALAENAQLLEYQESEIGSVAAFDADLERLLARHHRDKEPLGFLEMSFPGLDILVKERQDETFIEQLLKMLLPNAGVYHTGGDHLVCALIGPGEDDLRQRSRDLQHALHDLRQEFGLPMEVTINILPRWYPVGSDEVTELSSGRADLFRSSQKPDLDQEVARLTSGELTLREAKAALERRYIIAELFRSRGNITRAAEALGIHRPQLSNLLKRHEIRKEDFEGDSGKGNSTS